MSVKLLTEHHLESVKGGCTGWSESTRVKCNIVGNHMSRLTCRTFVSGTYKAVTLLLYCVTFFVLGCWTYGLAIPSGLFIPSLLIGAAWGRLFGLCLQLMFPTAVCIL